MENYILYIIDTETTGLSPENNEIVQLSAIRCSLDNEELNEQKTWFIKATKPETIEDEALKISGLKKEDMLWLTDYGKQTYIEPVKAIEDIERWISEDDQSSADRVFVGQNPKFDFEFMENTWKRFNAIDTFPFVTGHNKLIQDTKSLALTIDILVGKKRSRYNLGSLVAAFGVKKDKAHSADGDSRMTKDLFFKQAKGLSEAAKKAFSDCYKE